MCTSWYRKQWFFKYCNNTVDAWLIDSIETTIDNVISTVVVKFVEYCIIILIYLSIFYLLEHVYVLQIVNQ